MKLEELAELGYVKIAHIEKELDIYKMGTHRVVYNKQGEFVTEYDLEHLR